MLTLIFQSPITDIKFFLNNQEISVESIEGNCANINIPSFGLHHLKITSLTDQRIIIKKVLLNGCDIRKLLYLSWAIDCNNQQHQPCVELWQKGMSWVLPFIHPLSNWLAAADKKFNNNEFGKNLLEKYIFYYPESQKIDEAHHLPTIISDFYQYNFDFTVIPKDNLNQNNIPYMKYNKCIPTCFIDSIRDEIYQNKSIVENSNVGVPSSAQANADEFNLSDMWKVFWVIKSNFDDMSVTVSELDRFPSIKKLLDYLNLDVCQCFIGILPPQQYIYPHVDDGNISVKNYSKYQGCTQLYIPIDWPVGSSIKLANAGTVPMDNGPMVINVDHFTHAAVNLSNQSRIIITFRVSQEIVNDCTLGDRYSTQSRVNF